MVNPRFLRVQDSNLIRTKDGSAINLRWLHDSDDKEISRVILESFRVERDDYALGASKVFMRENLEAVLEKHRQDILEVEVLKLQRHVRGYLARSHFEKMKSSALIIQSAYRGWLVRKEYSKVRCIISNLLLLKSVYWVFKNRSKYKQV